MMQQRPPLTVAELGMLGLAVICAVQRGDDTEKAQPQMMQQPILYYGPQKLAVEDLLWSMGVPRDPRKLIGIDLHTWYKLDATEYLKFVQIEGHPFRPPAELLERLWQRGAIVIRVDDSAARSLRQSRMKGRII